MTTQNLIVEFVRVDCNAVIPTKTYDSDIGYDLTAISVYKVLSKNTFIYDTGIAIKPPDDYYIEILPRSSITKTGMMLANSVGIIDPNYRDSLKIAVRYVDELLERPAPPFCKFQLVLRKAECFTFREVTVLNDTDRGNGAFGSTDMARA